MVWAFKLILLLYVTPALQVTSASGPLPLDYSSISLSPGLSLCVAGGGAVLHQHLQQVPGPRGDAARRGGGGGDQAAGAVPHDQHDLTLLQPQRRADHRRPQVGS